MTLRPISGALKKKLEFAFLLCTVILGFRALGQAQLIERASHPAMLQQTGPVEGTLTVTATVVSSVGILLGPNGERTIVVANAPDGIWNIAQPQTKTKQNGPLDEGSQNGSTEKTNTRRKRRS
jgi:hypothetical protein